MRIYIAGKLQPKSTKGDKSVDGSKLGYLESIRGLAAFAVVFAHILSVYLPGVLLQDGSKVADNALMSNLFFGIPMGFAASGHFAVVLFFVLSGFVLTYRFFQTNNQQDLHRQAAKRYFRLAIPIFAIVLISYVMLSNGLMSNSDKVIELTGSQEVARNFNFTPELSEAFYAATIGVIAENNVKYNPVLWTMPVEFFGSFIVFGLAAFITKTRRRWVIYAGALLLLSDSYYVCFILGMLLADILQNTNIVDFVRDRVSKVYYFMAAILVWVIACFPVPGNGLHGTIYESFLIPNVDSMYIFKICQYFGAFILLALILISIRVQSILNNRFFVFLGGISFAVYLVHYLILYSAGHYSYVLSRGVYGATLSAIIAGAVTVILTLGVAVLWKKYVDDLSVRVSRAFATYILR
jgi:peptidoglycan/LPS O-acetylase OafA/YrhL